MGGDQKNSFRLAKIKMPITHPSRDVKKLCSTHTPVSLTFTREL